MWKPFTYNDLAFLGGLIRQDILPFIIEVKTDSFDSGSKQFTLPTTGSGYDFTVDWGDSTSNTYSGSPGNITHTYPSAGTYDISIIGDFPRIFFNNAGSKNKLIEIKQWGDIQWSSFENAFLSCLAMDISATDAPNLSGVTSMRQAFGGIGGLGLGGHNFNAWDVSNVTDMALMFTGSTSFNRPLGDWDVSNVTDMTGLFYFTNFNQDISGWCVENIGSEPQFFSTSLSNANKPNWGAAC